MFENFLKSQDSKNCPTSHAHLQQNILPSRLRVYDLPAEALEQGPLGAADGGDAAAAPDNLPAVLYVDEGETIYDYAWYPGMLASDPASCVFASTVRVCGHCSGPTQHSTPRLLIHTNACTSCRGAHDLIAPRCLAPGLYACLLCNLCPQMTRPYYNADLHLTMIQTCTSTC